MNHASTLHPTVLVKIGKEEVRVMLDSGAGSSYLCTDVITKLKLKPVKKEQRCMTDVWDNSENRSSIQCYRKFTCCSRVFN